MPDNNESTGEHFLEENVFLTILKYFPFYVIASFPPVQSNIALLSAKNVSLFYVLVSAQVKINSLTWFTSIIF